MSPEKTSAEPTEPVDPEVPQEIDDGEETLAGEDGEDPEPEDGPQSQPSPTGGGGPGLVEETIARVSTNTGDQPLVSFTFWIDGDTLHVLAEPLEEDGDFSKIPRYEWFWGDGTTTTGGAYETHEYDTAVEQVIVTVNRLDEEGLATHEGVQWIDLTYYEYTGEDPAPLPGKVIALDGTRGSRPMTSDIGELIEAAPLPSVAPLIGLVATLTFFARRRLRA